MQPIAQILAQIQNLHHSILTSGQTCYSRATWLQVCAILEELALQLQHDSIS